MGVRTISAKPPGPGPTAPDPSTGTTSASITYTITSSTMANAMLEDSFKSSHPDLMAACTNGVGGNNSSRDEDDQTRHALDNPHSSLNSSGGTAAVAPPKRGALQSIYKYSNSRLLEAPAVSSSSGGASSGAGAGAIPLKDVSPSRKKSVDFALEHRQQQQQQNHHHHHQQQQQHDRQDASSSPPLPKRARRGEPWSPKQVVDAVSTCFYPHERLEAVQKARDAFDHDSQATHDDEMRSGADAALVKHLTFLVYQCQHPPVSSSSSVNSVQQQNPQQPNPAVVESLTNEIGLTLEALQSLYRASSNLVGASFHRMGSHVLQLLLHLMEREMDRRFETYVDDEEVENEVMANTNDRDDADNDYNSDRQSPSNHRKTPSINDDDGTDPGGKHDMSSSSIATAQSGTSSSPPKAAPCVRVRVNPDAITPEGDNLLKMSTKILCHFARVVGNTKAMAHYPGLLTGLIRFVTLQPEDTVPWEARLSALWCLANLACNTENMQMMACTPDLVASLVQVARRPLHTGESLERVMELLRSRSNVSKAILNLSWAPENKILLAEQPGVVDLLSDLSVQRCPPQLFRKSRTVRDVLDSTRRHSVSALRNLAAAPRRVKIGLCEYRNGRLLDVLTDAALNDSDDSVRNLALAAIHNLAIQDTAIKIVNHPALVLALRGVLQSSDYDDRGGDPKSSPRSHAAATLLVLERTITPDMDCYETLRDLLDAANPAMTIDSDDGDDSSSDELNAVNATEV